MAEYFPIALDIKAKRCVVIGGGGVARRKVESLIECGAMVTVISPEACSELWGLAEERMIEWVRRPYRHGDLGGAVLVMAATDSEGCNQEVYQEALEKGLLVNVCDDPPRCNFIVPSVIRRGNLTIAVTTDGKSPMLARKIREDLELAYGNEYELFLSLMGRIRRHVLESAVPAGDRPEIFRRLVYSDLIELLHSGDRESVRRRAIELVGRELPEEVFEI